MTLLVVIPGQSEGNGGAGGAQKPTPIADRGDADLLHIVCGQVRQHVPIDCVFGKGGRVSPEAEAA